MRFDPLLSIAAQHDSCGAVFSRGIALEAALRHNAVVLCAVARKGCNRSG